MTEEEHELYESEEETEYEDDQERIP